MATCIDQFQNDRAVIYHGDSCEVLKAMPANSIDYMIYSPPFASLYTYSNSDRDLGNCKSRDDFFQHYRFIAEELYRILKPGRVLSFHCMNLPSTKERDGFIGIHDFRGELIRAHIGEDAYASLVTARMLRSRSFTAYIDAEKAGVKTARGEMLSKRGAMLAIQAAQLEDEMREHPASQMMIFHSEVCIWKDPVTAMQRTKAIGLLYKQLRKDSCISRQGIPDYLVTMRKPGENLERVTKTHESFPVDRWQNYASPVWMDINPSDTLQRESAREDNDERHICPLQLQVIERGIELWTNPNDVVLSPFAGIGSECFQAVKMGRRAIGIELKESYYKQAVLNVKRAAKEATQETLFPATEEVAQ
jgi:DNA modification methylase